MVPRLSAIYVRSMSNKPIRKPPISLLNLPAELRQEIYTLVVVNAHGPPIQIRYHRRAALLGLSQDHIQPSLSQVCRQLRDETLPLYYGKNNFSLHQFCIVGNRIRPDLRDICTGAAQLDRLAFQRWIGAIGDKNVSFLTDIRVMVLVMVAGAYVFEIDFSLQPSGFMMPENFGPFTRPAPASVQEELVALLTPVVEAQTKTFSGVGYPEKIEETISRWSWMYWDRDPGYVDNYSGVDQRQRRWTAA